MLPLFWAVILPPTKNRPQGIASSRSVFFYGYTASFGKEAQREILCQFKVSKAGEYCMHFPFLELQKWHKRSAEIRRRNCAVLPYDYFTGAEERRVTSW